jgi:PAS domain-containing protein
MFASLPSIVAGQTTPIVGAPFVFLAVVCISYRRLLQQNRRFSTALNNMSQGLNMFDAHGRIILLNKRYLEMYKLSPDVVKPGCTLKRLIEYRKETGLFAGDVDSYVKKILEAMALGKSQEHYVKASDGRIVLAKNEPLPGAAGCPRTRMSQSSGVPKRSARLFADKRNGGRALIPPLRHFGRRSRHCFRR